MKTKAPVQKNPAFTIVEIFIVVTVIALLAVIALPNFLRSSSTARLNGIYDNLRVVSDAKEMWALSNGKTAGAPTDMIVLNSYFLRSVKPLINETYVPNPLGTPAIAQLPGGVALPPLGAGAAVEAK